MNRNGISYGGIALPRPSPEMAVAVERFIETAAVDEMIRPYWTGLADWRGADFAPTRRVPLGRLYWPSGASRFSLFRTVASEAQLDSLRKTVTTAGSQGVVPLDLIIDDGQDPGGTRFVKTKMYMLPSTPFIQWAGNDTPKGSYLVTLVDDRYWWWRKPANIDVSGMKWSDLLTAIGNTISTTFRNQAGVAITADDIPEDYLFPSSKLTSSYEYLPLLLDAALYSIQRRLLRGLDGSITIQGPDDAATAVNALFVANANRREFGGIYRTDATSIHQELTIAVPRQVRVRFPLQTLAPTLSHTSYVAPLASLTLEEYDGITPRDGDKVFHTDAVALNTTGGPDDNAIDLQDLTNQLASDWYIWQTQDMASVYGGIIPWDKESMSDFVEYDGYGMRTEIRRAPINDLSMKVHHGLPGGLGSGGSGSGSAGECIDNFGGVILEDLPLYDPSGEQLFVIGQQGGCAVQVPTTQCGSGSGSGS